MHRRISLGDYGSRKPGGAGELDGVMGIAGMGRFWRHLCQWRQVIHAIAFGLLDLLGRYNSQYGQTEKQDNCVVIWSI